MSNPRHHQVIHFRMVDFQGEWTSIPVPAGFRYEPYGDAILRVVYEEVTGAVQRTRTFKIEEGCIVWIDRNVVHVPAHCERVEPGNTVDCDVDDVE